jgi:hypothetical protein
MGAAMDSRVVECKGRDDLLLRVWRQTVEDARYMHGHGGYTGTLAEKWEVVIIPGTWDEEGASEHCVENNDKWGPAFAYNLGDGRWYIGGWCSS